MDDIALIEARKSHVKYLAKITRHLNDFSNLKVEKLKIKMVEKTSVENKIKKLKLSNSKGIYGFFVNPKFVTPLRKKLDSHRLKRATDQSREAMPKPNHNNEAHNGCIYIGMIREKNLQYRILQHLHGTKSPKTSSLKLHDWAGEIVNEITLHYIIFPDHIDNGLIEEYEKALWNHYRPAIGKL